MVYHQQRRIEDKAEDGEKLIEMNNVVRVLVDEVEECELKAKLSLKLFLSLKLSLKFSQALSQLSPSSTSSPLSQARESLRERA